MGTLTPPNPPISLITYVKVVASLCELVNALSDESQDGENSDNGSLLLPILGAAAALDRSCTLWVRANRRHDDRRNSQERAARLHDLLSKEINLRLEREADLCAEELDNARDLALATSEGATEDQILEQVNSELRSIERGNRSCVFLVNFCYELLERCDKWIHFLETGNGPNVIERIIDFPPEHFAAGAMVLNEFASIIRSRHGESGVHVRIHQSDLRVKLLVETTDSKEEIERALDEYGEVLTGVRALEQFAESTTERLRLESALELANVRLSAEQRISNVLDTEVREMGRRLDALTRLLADSMASNREITTRSYDFASAALSQLSDQARQEVLSELVQFLATHVDDEARDELNTVARVVADGPDSENLDEAELQLRDVTRRAINRRPRMARILASPLCASMLSQQASAWIETLLGGI